MPGSITAPIVPRSALAERLGPAGALAFLPVRVIQGFIFWGGGSRRLIYDPHKLDPHAADWLANKLQSAMPGALLGTGHAIGFLLGHFWLLYPALILFSAAELVAGAALMAGLLTRAAALVSIGFALVLMLTFGWQGATCIDEWTMSACNLAMGATILLAGSGGYSLDNLMLARRPALAARGWFRWLGGSLPLPLAEPRLRQLGLALIGAVLAFDIGTYSYFRGSVVTPYHSGPVSPSQHHLALSAGSLLADGSVDVRVYLDAGTPATPAHIMRAALLGPDGRTREVWDTRALSDLPASAIRNDYPYNRFRTGPYGLLADLGARATLRLPAQTGPQVSNLAEPRLVLTDVNGRSFSLKLTPRGTKASSLRASRSAG